MHCPRCSHRHDAETPLIETTLGASDPANEEAIRGCPECGHVWHESDGDIPDGQVVRLNISEYVLWVRELDAGYQEVREWPGRGVTDTERIIGQGDWRRRLQQALGVKGPDGANIVATTAFPKILSESEAVELRPAEEWPL